MSDAAHESIQVNASPERCYAVALDFERYPDWAKDVRQVDVLERDEQGRGTKVEYRAAAMGRSIQYVLEYDFTDAPSEFSWKLVEGDTVRTLDGTYRFDSSEGGTTVDYWLTIDLAFPLPGLVKRRASGLILSTALKELKREAEKGQTA